MIGLLMLMFLSQRYVYYFEHYCHLRRAGLPPPPKTSLFLSSIILHNVPSSMKSTDPFFIITQNNRKGLQYKSKQVKVERDQDVINLSCCSCFVCFHRFQLADMNPLVGLVTIRTSTFCSALEISPFYWQKILKLNSKTGMMILCVCVCVCVAIGLNWHFLLGVCRSQHDLWERKALPILV